MRRSASATMSSNSRSSSLGAGIMGTFAASRRCAEGRQRRGLRSPALVVVWLAQVEGIDQVAGAVGRPHHVRDADVEPVRLAVRRLGGHLDLVDAWLPLAQGLLAVVDGQAGGHGVVGREQELVDVAPEVAPLDALAGCGAEDDEDGFADVLLLRGGGDAARAVDGDREAPAAAEKVASIHHDRAASLAETPLDELLAGRAADACQ